MTSSQLQWSMITERHAARIMQQFSCTTDRPRTPNGRRLPHPKPWEFEAQSYLRDAWQRLRPDDLLLVGRDQPEEGPVQAAAWLQRNNATAVAGVFIAAAGIGIAHRGRGGGTADDLMDKIIQTATSFALTASTPRVVVMGNVHVQNIPSQKMVVRAGFEPVGVPSGTYQTWATYRDIGEALSE